jgi:predicted Fe-Mo cluster-binding NifX family protein
MKESGAKTLEEDPKETSYRRIRILIPLLGDDVAPRFDLAPEALIVAIEPDGRARVEKSIVLPQASAEALCGFVMTEKVDVVVCCGIEEEYYQYLTWKKAKVIDSVMGPYPQVLERLTRGTILDGEILIDRKD